MSPRTRLKRRPEQRHGPLVAPLDALGPDFPGRFQIGRKGVVRRRGLDYPCGVFVGVRIVAHNRMLPRDRDSKRDQYYENDEKGHDLEDENATADAEAVTDGQGLAI